MTRISSPVENGPEPAGSYSASVRIGTTVAVAGQCGYLPDRTLVEGLTPQTQLAMQNVQAALAAAGAAMDDVINVSVYLVDVDHFQEFNAAYSGYFTEPYPARTTIYCGLRPGVLVEVGVLAVTSDA